MRLRWRLREFLWSIPIVKRFSADNFVSHVKSGPKMAVSGEWVGLHVNFLFPNPEKAHPCVEPRRLMYYAWKSVQGPRPRGRWKNTEQKKPSKPFLCAISRIRGKETPRGIVTKFCTLVDIQDLITYITFGDGRL